jgi:hypothetical protein
MGRVFTGGTRRFGVMSSGPRIGIDQVAGLMQKCIARSVASARADPAIGAARACRLSRMRISRPGAPRHLRVAHGLEPAEYRVRWKLPPDHPITAPAYSERRSTMAKQIGLGRKSQEAVVSTPEVVAAPPQPALTGQQVISLGGNDASRAFRSERPAGSEPAARAKAFSTVI